MDSSLESYHFKYVISFTYLPSPSASFGANWTVIPAESGHLFRVKLDSDSGGNWTLIPVKTGQPFLDMFGASERDFQVFLEDLRRIFEEAASEHEQEAHHDQYP